MPYIGKSPSAGVRQRYQYTATAGQTTFSGTDLGNLTLTYTDNNFVDVFQNGVLLKGGGTDYTATSGTSVVLATGASVSDVIEIIVYDVFSVGNFFNRTDSDSRYLNVAGDTMTGSLDLNGTELVLDADGDTTITADTDDQIDIKIAGSDKLKIDASSHLVTTTAGTSNLVLGVNAGNSIASGGNYNVCVGDEAGTAITTGDRNTAVGFEALKTATTAQYNVAVGYQALENNTGNNNTAVGDQALEACTSGTNNTAVGDDAGVSITTGIHNTIMGVSAGDALTDADYNVAIGGNSLSTDTQGSRSTAVGYGALNGQNQSSAADVYNVAVGYTAGNNVSTGKANTLIGGVAGGGGTLSGDDNTCVGYTAGYSITSGDNNLCLGHNAGLSTSPSGSITTGSDTICLGDNDINDLFCADTSISSSDSRDKTDVTNFNGGLDWVKALRPVTYKWDKRSWYGDDDNPMGTPDGSKKRNRLHVGFLAQEVLQIEQDNGFADTNDTSLIVRNNLDETSYGLKYERLVPVLVNAIKELSAKNDALEARIKKLEDG